MSLHEIVILFLCGLISGFFAGLIGIGGGLFYIIIYTYFFQKLGVTDSDEFVRLIITNSIFSTLFAALAASIKQIRLNNFFPRYVLMIGIPAAVASIGITFLLGKTQVYTKQVFAIAFSIALIPLIWRMLLPYNPNTIKPLSKLPQPLYWLTGIISGAATALSGLGGSFVMTPLLNGGFRLDIKKIVSIAVGVIVIVALTTSVFNFFTQTFEDTKLKHTIGGLNFPLTLPVIAGVLLAAPFGVQMATKFDRKVLRYIFAAFCIAVIMHNAVIFFA